MRISKWLMPRYLLIALVAFSFLIIAQFQFHRLPERQDAANWNYMAQLIARGNIPYRDAVNIKTPLSAYAGAAAILILHPFGARDLMAIRCLFILLGALVIGCTFLVTFAYCGSRRTALLAALILLSSNYFANAHSRGVEPKTLMVLFGLLTLLAIYRNRPISAGLCGMLSALSWQPGLLFVGVAGLIFSSYGRSWRDIRLLKGLLGALMPLAIMLFYFWVVRVLHDFYTWNLAFTFSVYSVYRPRSPVEFVQRVGNFMRNAYRSDAFYFFLALIGWVSALYEQLKPLLRNHDGRIAPPPVRSAVIISPLIYLLFCMVQINGERDFLPLLPFAGVFAALAIASFLQRGVARIIRNREPSTGRSIEYGSWGLIFTLIVTISLADILWLEREFGTLQEQEREVSEITAHLQPGDEIFVHGAAEVLVLSHLTNASKYFFLDRGKDEYLDKLEPGGFDGWLARLKASRPKVVVLARMNEVSRKTDFQAWVQRDYRKVTRTFFTYYVRKE